MSESSDVENLYRKEAHDQWAEAKTMEHASGVWGREPMLEYLKDFIKPGDVVVDLGSGAGYPSLRVSEMVGDTGTVIGIERSQAMLGIQDGQEPISKKYDSVDNLHFVAGDVTKLPLAENSADKAVSFMVLHNLTIDQVRDALKETGRVLKPGGKAAFLTMHPDALNDSWDLDFMNYNKDDLGAFANAEDKEGVKVRGTVKNVGGGEKSIMMFNHTRENMISAAHDAGLEIADEKDFWVDEKIAKEKFGEQSTRKVPTTPTFWLLVLEKTQQ